MILRKTVFTKLACLFHVIVNISFSYDLFIRKQQTFKNQMLESHHLISSVISPATIPSSRYWPRVQLSFEHVGLSHSKLFFKNWECFSVRWHWQLRASTSNCISTTRARCVEPSFKNWMQCHRSRIDKNFWNISPTHYKHWWPTHYTHYTLYTHYAVHTHYRPTHYTHYTHWWPPHYTHTNALYTLVTIHHFVKTQTTHNSWSRHSLFCFASCQ